MPKYLEEKEIDTLHQLYMSGMKQKDIAKKMGRTRSNISTMISRQRWLHPEKWPERNKKEKEKINDSSLKEARLNRVVILDTCDFFWDERELIRVANMWKKGISIEEMAETFDRDSDEVILALLHLARNKKIERRKGGLFG